MNAQEVILLFIGVCVGVVATTATLLYFGYSVTY